jgi:CBS domain-containing protein
MTTVHKILKAKGDSSNYSVPASGTVLDALKVMAEEQCMALMDAYHIRHLPVVEKDQLVGVVSIRDVMVAALENKDSEIKGLENYLLASGFAG